MGSDKCKDEITYSDNPITSDKVLVLKKSTDIVVHIRSIPYLTYLPHCALTFFKITGLYVFT